jgi:dTDP-4-amino-4,6-dideoxygalactose transaminase
MAHLKAEGIGSIIHYPIPIHLQKAYAGKWQEGTFSETARAAKEILSIPIYPTLSDAAVDRVIEVVREFFKK